MRRNLLVGAVVLGLSCFAAGWLIWGKLPFFLGSNAGSWSERDLPDSRQDWLLSPTGGAVPMDVIRAYLDQSDLIPERGLLVTVVAPLTTLLAEGEPLPDTLYHPVMADIRAPVLAERLCPVLTARLADRCAVDFARVRKGSLDPVQATATFTLALRFSQPVTTADLPDLARHVLETRVIPLPAPAGRLQSLESVLTALLDAANAACRAEAVSRDCRVLRLSMDFAPGREATGQAVIGALYPLPDGLRPAPELVPAPQN